jgi:Rieske Fe-S protein
MFFSGILVSSCDTSRLKHRKERKFKLGNKSSFRDPQTILPVERILVHHDQGGFAAMSLVCTHQMCLVRPAESSNFICPCHGSKFNQNGQVLTGPANRDLEWYKIELRNANELWVDVDNKVDSKWRLVDSESAQ